ncbi:ribonuclease HII [Rhodopseudomonas boonkerdii]|uniref:ribonuclease HII n=1 Tax=Rhodopseudomonas boonkerdii TaxID=475937 RepID=UPI001E351964|nr:ribonuclease HII [Rhodopseudomonas boonkerdii]UGV24862.1 ribonuclease HII [Rhodopseudomonas boonkerdii]
MDVLTPNFDLETEAHGQCLNIVAGCDEVGRGAIAGPVVAAAVILDPDQIPPGIDDSKRLSPSRRAALFLQIRATSFIGVGFASHHRVDRDNVLQASLWALARAVLHLPIQPDLVLVDGPIDIQCPIPTRAVVHGDQISLSVAAASIVAKVVRDRFMENTSRIYPDYGFQKHKGYGTKLHLQRIQELGHSIIHRRCAKT